MVRASRQRGFTLIELLVVVSVIGIIAAILFPVFSAAREKARQTSCLSNIAQLGKATMLYAQDWNETYPLGLISCSNNGHFYTQWNYASGERPCSGFQETWMDLLHSYVKTWSVFHCANTAYTQGVFAPPGTPRDRLEYSYGVSYYFSRLYDAQANAWWQPRTTRPTLSLAEVVRPEEKVYMADSAFGQKGETPFPWLYIDSIQFRHMNGVNIGFADGHARWYSRNSRYGDLLDADGNDSPGTPQPPDDDVWFEPNSNPPG